MMRTILYAIGGLYVLTAIYMFLAPQSFYDLTPGVAMMGPFNLHFIRDAGLAFLVSGGALVWGAAKQDRTALVLGALWPCLHAAFHIWIWFGRGLPVDEVALVNLFGIQLPAWMAMVAARRIKLAAKS